MPLVAQFTRDGRPTGRELTIPRTIPQGRANDVHLDFDRGADGGDVVLVFTKDGEEVARHTAPAEAHDVGIEFRDDTDDVSPGKAQVRDVHWTDAQGKRIGDYVAPPRGSNDVHVHLPKKGKFTKGRWTIDGRPLPGDFDPPVDANDFHLAPDTSRTVSLQLPKELLIALPAVLATLLGARGEALRTLLEVDSSKGSPEGAPPPGATKRG
jgi:hypothetical protein